jgi:glyoxylase-like metal-dependent hydrolase (beta-lactamase superfamily II)
MQISAIPEDAPVRAPVGVQLIRANNPGVMSLAGTNTWILAGREAGETVVIDPGPLLDEHLAAIRAAGSPAAIVLTHHHLDHSEAAPALADEFGTPIYAALPELARNTKPLAESDVIDVAGWQLAVLATPGHTSDSVCLSIEGALFTGDTLLGGSTTIVAPPTGSLAEYFATMHRLSAFTDVPGFPGHGPAFGSVGAWAVHNAAYREQRLAQLVEIVTQVAAATHKEDRAAVLKTVASAAYGENGEPVAPYIEVMTNAQLQFLGDRGDIPPWDYAGPAL